MEVRGEGVVLRPWRLEDVPAVTAACQDAEIARWLAFVPQPYTEEDARFYVQDCLAAGEDRNAVRDRRRRDRRGDRLDRDAHQPDADRSHRLLAGRRGAWPRAHADALLALSRWGFEELGLGRVELVTDPDNIASQRVAEKAGFTREGILRSILVNRDGSRRDGVMFSLLPDELD